jgi:hypothetical protein
MPIFNDLNHIIAMDRAGIPASVDAMHPINSSIAADNGFRRIPLIFAWLTVIWGFWLTSFH